MKEIKIKKTKQKRSNAKFEAILNACPRVFNEFGYEKSTTERIALEADVSIGTVYDYFSSKEAVFIAYLDRELNKVLEDVARKAALADLDSHDITRKYVSIAVDFVHNHRDMLRTMLAKFPDVIPQLDFAQESKKLMATIGRNFGKNERIRPHRRDSQVMMYTVTNIFLGFLLRMVAMNDDGFDREVMVDELSDLLYRYIYDTEAR